LGFSFGNLDSKNVPKRSWAKLKEALRFQFLLIERNSSIQKKSVSYLWSTEFWRYLMGEIWVEDVKRTSYREIMVFWIQARSKINKDM
jgi:hypothetical protein